MSGLWLGTLGGPITTSAMWSAFDYNTGKYSYSLNGTSWTESVGVSTIPTPTRLAHRNFVGDAGSMSGAAIFSSQAKLHTTQDGWSSFSEKNLTTYGYGTTTSTRPYAVAIGGSTVVVVGGNGRIVRSTDGGMNFDPVTSGTTTRLTFVTWDGSKFVAFNTVGGTFNSADGATWSAAAASSTLGINTDVMSDLSTGKIYVVTGAVLKESTDSGVTFTTSTTTGVQPAVTSVYEMSYSGGPSGGVMAYTGGNNSATAKVDNSTGATAGWLNGTVWEALYYDGVVPMDTSVGPGGSRECTCAFDGTQWVITAGNAPGALAGPSTSGPWTYASGTGKYLPMRFFSS